jgi:hypothetical protein
MRLLASPRQFFRLSACSNLNSQRSEIQHISLDSLRDVPKAVSGCNINTMHAGFLFNKFSFGDIFGNLTYK